MEPPRDVITRPIRVWSARGLPHPSSILVPLLSILLTDRSILNCGPKPVEGSVGTRRASGFLPRLSASDLRSNRNLSSTSILIVASQANARQTLYLSRTVCEAENKRILGALDRGLEGKWRLVGDKMAAYADMAFLAWNARLDDVLSQPFGKILQGPSEL